MRRLKIIEKLAFDEVVENTFNLVLSLVGPGLILSVSKKVINCHNCAEGKLNFLK